jgi:hypothetical protein
VHQLLKYLESEASKVLDYFATRKLVANAKKKKVSQDQRRLPLRSPDLTVPDIFCFAEIKEHYFTALNFLNGSPFPPIFLKCVDWCALGGSAKGQHVGGMDTNSK